jgi:hypothetical protein
MSTPLRVHYRIHVTKNNELFCHVTRPSKPSHYINYGLQCSDMVCCSDVTKNSNLMWHLDTFKGIQPITGRVSVTSDTL